jgi:LysR family transcriptional regulator, cyn operon transcriptional activator
LLFIRTIALSYQGEGVELRHLRYFLAVAEEAHFRRAAEALHVSQPTLSLQVQELEKELGVALFDRIGRRVRLTQAGQVFRDYARRALAVLDDGKAALGEIDGMLRGSLCVGVVQTVNAYLIPPVIARFSTDYPNVRLRVEELAAVEIENGILNGTLDLGVSFLPPAHKEIESEHLFDEEFVLAVPLAHRLASRDRITLSELDGEPLCLLGKKFCTRRIIDEGFIRAGVQPVVAVEMNSVEGIVAVVKAGGPATILPALALSGQSLKAVRIDRPTPKRTVSLLKLKGHAPLRARTVFSELVAATLHRAK